MSWKATTGQLTSSVTSASGACTALVRMKGAVGYGSSPIANGTVLFQNDRYQIIYRATSSGSGFLEFRAKRASSDTFLQISTAGDGLALDGGGWVDTLWAYGGALDYTDIVNYVNGGSAQTQFADGGNGSGALVSAGAWRLGDGIADLKSVLWAEIAVWDAKLTSSDKTILKGTGPGGTYGSPKNGGLSAQPVLYHRMGNSTLNDATAAITGTWSTNSGFTYDADQPVVADPPASGGVRRARGMAGGMTLLDGGFAG